MELSIGWKTEKYEEKKEARRKNAKKKKKRKRKKWLKKNGNKWLSDTIAIIIDVFSVFLSFSLSFFLSLAPYLSLSVSFFLCFLSPLLASFSLSSSLWFAL